MVCAELWCEHFILQSSLFGGCGCDPREENSEARKGR